MNVLKLCLQTTIKTLLHKEISQREIQRKTGIDRKTIRRYGQSYDSDEVQESGDSKSPTPATGFGTQNAQACPLGL
jgi:transposase